MNFDEFALTVETKLGYRPTKIKGISNIARIMEGVIFLAGPNLERFDGNRPYAFCSKLSFSPNSHLFFCLGFKNAKTELVNAVAKLDQERINNCKIILDNDGIFLSTSADVNSGSYIFNPKADQRINSDSFYYYLPAESPTSNETVTWILNRLKGNSVSIEKISDSTTQGSFDYTVFKRDLDDAGLFFSDSLIARFTSSLLTKPFVILTGLSGSGKTKLAQAFAMWISETSNQYCIVPVGADWTNREPLLGFPNALKDEDYKTDEYGVLKLIIDSNDDLDRPYFLILDEMNLSHVERYFADFLSVMESKGKMSLHSGDKGWNGVPSEIGFPKNLFIIGTVNIDETTYMFSPKVLDRANVIEFRVTEAEMSSYLKNNSIVSIENLNRLGAPMASSFIEISKSDLKVPDPTELNKSLMSFFSELKKTGAEFGYRSASEIIRFAAVVKMTAPNWSNSHVIDAAIMQKLLPKVHGSRRKLEPVLKTLGALCLQEGYNIDDFLTSKFEIDFNDATKFKYPVSLEKILRMYSNLLSNSFTSYSEV